MGIKAALDLSPMLLDEQVMSIPRLTYIMYDLCETGVNDEELIKESLSDTPGPIEELFKELIAPVTTSDLYKKIKLVLAGDDTL